MQCHGAELTEELLFYWTAQVPPDRYKVESSSEHTQECFAGWSWCCSSVWQKWRAGGLVGQQWMHMDPAFQDFPRGSKARRGIVLRSRDLRSFALTARLCERQLQAALRTQWRPCPALAGDVHCNCALTPGNTEPTASSQLHPSQLPAQGFAPRVLLLPPQGKPCPLNLCLFFQLGVGLVPSHREEIPKDPLVLHPLMIVFHQELCRGTVSDLFFKTKAML